MVYSHLMLSTKRSQAHGSKTVVKVCRHHHAPVPNVCSDPPVTINPSEVDECRGLAQGGVLSGLQPSPSLLLASLSPSSWLLSAAPLSLPSKSSSSSLSTRVVVQPIPTLQQQGSLCDAEDRPSIEGRTRPIPCRSSTGSHCDRLH